MHELQLIFTTSLEAAGIVENVTIMSFENELVIYVMEPTLQPQSSWSRSAVANKNMSVQPQLKGQVEPNQAMRPRVPPGAKTYLRASSPLIKRVDLGTLRSVADTLQNGRLSCICSSDDQNPKLDIGDLKLILLGSHGKKSLVRRETGQGAEQTCGAGTCPRTRTNSVGQLTENHNTHNTFKFN